jgi:hypothetical protein
VVRLCLIVCAIAGLQHGGAYAQAQPVDWRGLSGTSSSPLYTQRPASPLHYSLMSTAPADTVTRQIQPTHWKEGGVIGAVTVGAFGALLGSGICQLSENISHGCTGTVLGAALGGGLLGFVVGAFIGGQFPKHSAAEPGDTRS